jgi:N-acetylmuramoyl-L-alanine amidase
MKRPIILIDPGHGGMDPGATAHGVFEADIVLALSHYLGPLLHSAGFDVYWSRYLDTTTLLPTRVALAHTVQADLLLSLHCNAAMTLDAHGFEVWTSPGLTESDRVAALILTEVAKRKPCRRMRTDDGPTGPDKEARFYVLTQTRCPAVLVELGFISNPAERAWLLTENNQRGLAQAICTALVNWRDGHHD